MYKCHFLLFMFIMWQPFLLVSPVFLGLAYFPLVDKKSNYSGCERLMKTAKSPLLLASLTFPRIMSCNGRLLSAISAIKTCFTCSIQNLRSQPKAKNLSSYQVNNLELQYSSRNSEKQYFYIVRNCFLIYLLQERGRQKYESSLN